MSELVITPNLTRKTARFAGTVAAGEHAAVRIVGAASLVQEAPSDATLRLRVVFMRKTLAVFPFVTAAMAESDGSLVRDAWEISGDDLTCTLNLNTTQALKAFRKTPEMEVGVVLDDPVRHRLLFADLMLMRGWPQEPSDAPTDLDSYRDFVVDTTAALQSLQSGIDSNAAATERMAAALAGKADNADLDALATKAALEAEAGARQAADAGHDTTDALHDAGIELNAEGVQHAEAHITEHAIDAVRHVTATERARWDAKADAGDLPDLTPYAKREELEAYAKRADLPTALPSPAALKVWDGALGTVAYDGSAEVAVPKATAIAPGLVKLVDSVTENYSRNSGHAATPLAVKTVNDKVEAEAARAKDAEEALGDQDEMLRQRLDELFEALGSIRRYIIEVRGILEYDISELRPRIDYAANGVYELEKRVDAVSRILANFVTTPGELAWAAGVEDAETFDEMRAALRIGVGATVQEAVDKVTGGRY